MATVTSLVKKEAKIEAEIAELEVHFTSDKKYQRLMKLKQQVADVTIELIRTSVDEVDDETLAGEAADLFRTIKDFIDNHKVGMKNNPDLKILDAVSGAYKDMQEKIISLARKQKLTGATGEKGKFSFREEIVGTIEDWDKFTETIVENDWWELLTKKVNSKPYRDLIAEGKNVKGVTQYKVGKVTIGKK